MTTDIPTAALYNDPDAQQSNWNDLKIAGQMISIKRILCIKITRTIVP